MNYSKTANIFKALADENRLKIVEMILVGEQCACEILKNFDITQPTLSYHMKYLCDSGLVVSRKDGAWMKYKINANEFENIVNILNKFRSISVTSNEL